MESYFEHKQTTHASSYKFVHTHTAFGGAVDIRDDQPPLLVLKRFATHPWGSRRSGACGVAVVLFGLACIIPGVIWIASRAESLGDFTPPSPTPTETLSVGNITREPNDVLGPAYEVVINANASLSNGPGFDGNEDGESELPATTTENQYNATADLEIMFDSMGFKNMTKQMKIYIYPFTGKRMPISQRQYNIILPPLQEKVRLYNTTKNPRSKLVGEIGVEANTMGYANRGTFGSGGLFYDNLRLSRFLTTDPRKATFFFMPIACDGIRTAGRTRATGGFLSAKGHAWYVEQIKTMYPYWNRTQGADHFYVCSHIGATITKLADRNLQSKAIGLFCPGDLQNPYFVPQKDIVLPPYVEPLYEADDTWFDPTEKNILAFYAGGNDSRARAELHKYWANDTEIVVKAFLTTDEYTDTMIRSKYCLVPRGSKVNTPRINEVVWYGCVPVVLSDHYHLPLTGLLDWSKFAVLVPEADIGQLKSILKSIPDERYAEMLQELKKVRYPLTWSRPKGRGFDAFQSVMLLLWQRRHYIRYQNPIIEPFDDSRI
eukprot:comp6265_c0_seq1/m.2083 comp6265_c0_seq1/g.2083  ORF comp6265_c0_seq1/g.2083 comp6265_c0_seq1/m.2083 type:complete len:546 (-) comp6265_c0_seq1:451-2088(-)